MAKAQANGIEIEYDTLGDEDAPAVLLIAGLGSQLTRWAEPFCAKLAAEGFRVIRFDNRDVGLSTHFSGRPDIAAIARAAVRGERPDVPYALDDMAADAIGLLDALNVERAHLVGRSMGGMMGLLAASAHPRRVLSVTPIMSTTGAATLPQPAPHVLEALIRPAPLPSEDIDGFLAHGLAFARLIASPGHPFDAHAHRNQILSNSKRAHDPAGFGRQLAALVAAGDIRPRLQSITAPTLVVHGANDLLIPPAGGRDIAATVPGAGLRIIDGMGHDIPHGLFGGIVAAIVENARRARDGKPRPHMRGGR